MWEIILKSILVGTGEGGESGAARTENGKQRHDDVVLNTLRGCR